jgi:hypothetical protein
VDGHDRGARIGACCASVTRPVIEPVVTPCAAAGHRGQSSAGGRQRETASNFIIHLLSSFS